MKINCRGSLFLLFILLLTTDFSFAQCSGGNQTGDVIMPVWNNEISRWVNSNNYVLVNVIGGITYQISGYDTRICNPNGSGNITPSTGNGTFTFSTNFSGQVRIYNISVVWANIRITPVGGNNNIDSNTSTPANANVWREHFYGGTNFNNYLGFWETQPENFNEVFGGTGVSRLAVWSNSVTRIHLNKENFSANFRMRSTRRGLYTANIGSDDGSVLYVDGIKVYDDWSNHSYREHRYQLFNLTGNSLLSLEYYQNTGSSQVSFQNLYRIIENTISGNQTICPNGTGSTITGDGFNIPQNMNARNASYQWAYSTTPGGTLTDISGATSQNFTPNTSIAPFNNTGTYHMYRKASLTRDNYGVSNYTATNVSNAVVVTIGDNTPPTFSITPNEIQCVANITQAVFDSTNNDISPARPDYFLFENGNTVLDLDINSFNDNCCSPAQMTIFWEITFADGSTSGEQTGQPSTVTNPVYFPGDGTTFTQITHQINYWIEDCNGNKSNKQNKNIIINPRPDVQFQ